jgi:hypothetical protein
MRLLFVVVALVLSAAQAASAQVPAPGQCNADPTLSSDGLIVGSPLFTADQLRARLAREPGLAAQLDNPTVAGEFELLGRIFVLLGYPPLEDLDVLAEQVRAAHVFASVELNGRMCFTTPPPDRLAAVVDFYNTALDHYFYTADAGEIAAIESGAVGPGWTRTGETFDADVAPGCPSSIDTPVYRFAGTPGKGPSSHFFTRDRAECYVVKSSGQ